MEKSFVLKVGCVLGLVALLAACDHRVQTTSGSQYLAGYSGLHSTAGASAGIDPGIDGGIRAAADVEPQLRFPARLGLARIENGRLTSVPQGDAMAWRSLAERLGDGYGSFVPVSPLIAALAVPRDAVDAAGRCSPAYRSCLAQIVHEVRLGAARQHLDAVLIYETFGKSEETSNPLAVTKLALIGFFLPTEDVAAEGSAQAVLVDVRNGYTYGMASAVADKPVQRITTSGNSYAVQRAAQQVAQVRAVENLTGEVEAMLRDLRLALAEGRLAGDIR
ncbi:hypothetical protein HBA54_06405 [Pelagibius litoralis]|uniref:Uncharacterized protein n=1 Tax=Pelagibius litoralis TaxID=374515 RepID=A0A967CBI4_9PROT|nr:hypothetical protein [Pelagibius litoralis]NIA68219.1 hypothetical protein [Pelagibius litoralis]